MSSASTPPRYSLSVDDLRFYWEKGTIVRDDSEFRAWMTRNLAKDGEEPLRLGDNSIVFDHSKDTIRHYFWGGSNRKWPTDNGLVRLGSYFGLSPERLLLLILKVQAEHSFSINTASFLQNPDDLIKVLNGTPDGEHDFHAFASRRGRYRRNGFAIGSGRRAGIDQIFEMLNAHGIAEGYDDALFDVMATEATRDGLFLFSPASREVGLFADRWRAEIGQRCQASQSIRQRHHVARLHHMVCERDLGEVLWEEDLLRIDIGRISARYFGAVGDLEVRHAELIIEVERLARLIALKKELPQLQTDELDRLVSEAMTAELQFLASVRESAADGELYKAFGPGGFGHEALCRPIDDSEAARSYEAECRNLIAEIGRNLRLCDRDTHTDSQRRIGGNFTQSQSEMLDALFRTVQEQKKQLLKVGREELWMGNRSLDRLRAIEAKALQLRGEINAILEQEGLHVVFARNPPSNGSLEDLAAWLEGEAQVLTAEIGATRNRMTAMRQDKVYADQMATVGSPKTIADCRKLLEDRIAAIADQQLTPLQAEYDRLFAPDN